MLDTKKETEEYLKKGRELGKKLAHYKMLEEINTLVVTDFCEEMSMKSMKECSEKYTQEEATQMADLLGRIYLIAHCIHCHACQTKYLPTQG